MDLSEHKELVVRQEVERLEAFTGLETENQYSVSTPEGDQLLYAYEESDSMGRIFLNSHRPLSIHIVDVNEEPVLTASRSFFWYLSHLHVQDGAGREVGSLQRRFSVLTRRFDIKDSAGVLLAEIRGRLFRPNTFMVYKDTEEIARITKQWSGIGREAFTDADTFRVQMDTSKCEEDFALLILASSIAIDLDFFENSNSPVDEGF